jgi:hypothetical protein
LPCCWSVAVRAATEMVAMTLGLPAPPSWQDELIEALRSDGRRQAAHRMLRQTREGAPSGGR